MLYILNFKYFEILSLNCEKIYNIKWVPFSPVYRTNMYWFTIDYGLLYISLSAFTSRHPSVGSHFLEELILILNHTKYEDHSLGYV